MTTDDGITVDDLDGEWDEGRDCMTCGGEGWGEPGYDWDDTDPLWYTPGTLEPCPNCRGSGLAKDQWYW